MSFGSRLAAARKKAGLTQTQLGAGLGTDGADAGKQVVSGWENDLHYPRVDQLMKICERVKRGADYLLFDDATAHFSLEVARAVAALNTEDLARLEGVIQAHLGITRIGTHSVADASTQPLDYQRVTGQDGAPVGKPSPYLDTLQAEDRRDARSTARQVQKPGSHRGPKRAA